jgi:predicted dehydrogenase
VRALIVGLGAVGQRHARNLRALRPDIELHAWRRRGRAGTIGPALEFDHAADPAGALGIVTHASIEAALAARPDVAVVASPSALHLADTLAVLRGGCHTYVEKPLSHTIDGLGRLHAAAAGRVVAIGCQWRFHPLVEALRDLVTSRVLGDIVRADVDFSEYLPDWHPYEDYRESYAACAELGGGVVLSQIHDWDLVHWLFGPVRIVTARGGTRGELEVDVEDTVEAQCATARGQVFVRQTFAEREARRVITVRGALATATCNLRTGRLEVTPDVAHGLDVPDYDRNTMFLAAMDDFLRCAESGTAPRTALADGIAVLKVALAAKASLARGGPVPTQ